MQESIYRVSFEAAELLRNHPPRFRDSHKAALFDIAYPTDANPHGAIEVSRWAEHVEEPIHLRTTLATEIRADYYDYAPFPATERGIEWHVNFADPRLFVAYGSGLFAQDEMQVAQHPLLGSVREALLARQLIALTSDESGATPILIRNVERRIAVATNPDANAGRPNGLYGNYFAHASLDAIRNATRRINPPTFTNLIAIAAPSGGYGEYTERQISGIFATAFTGFRAAWQESVALLGADCKTAIHTGFWGCGAFGGNRMLMIALQTLAARAAGITQLIVHAGDSAGAQDAQRGLYTEESIAIRCGESCVLDTLVGRCAILGYRWGVSDGN